MIKISLDLSVLNEAASKKNAVYDSIPDNVRNAWKPLATLSSDDYRVAMIKFIASAGLVLHDRIPTHTFIKKGSELSRAKFIGDGLTSAEIVDFINTTTDQAAKFRAIALLVE